MTSESHSSDAFSPREIASRVEQIGVAKARENTLTLTVLAVLAGAFISLGAIFYLVVITESSLSPGLTRLIGGMCFSLGLILVVVAGAELFTGNNLLAMAWASGMIGVGDVIRNWLIVYCGNILGCLGTACFVLWADLPGLGEGAVGATALKAAAGKTSLSAGQAFARGVLCNSLVCLAVWLAMGCRSVVDKIFAILFPITAFVALGLEHSIANWFFLPLALALDQHDQILVARCAENLVVVSLGNIVGGSCLVAGVYWFAYLRSRGVGDDASAE